MTASEQSAYTTELTEYISNQLPLLTATPTTAEEVTNRKTALLAGFSLAIAFPFCRGFVRERLLFGDTTTSVCLRLAQYFQEIQKQVSVSIPTNISQQQDISHSPSLRGRVGVGLRHVGRPTHQEAQAYDKAVKAKKAAQDKIQPSVFPHPENSLPTGEGWGGAFQFTMREYRWLLSSDLQHDIDGLRDYRTAFSDASQKAKFLAEQYGSVRGGSAATLTPDQKAEISQYAQEAKKMNALIESIYIATDNELAEACLRLKYDPHYISDMQKKGVNTEELRQALVPKYKEAIARDPAFKQSILDKIADEDPALAQKRKALADAKSRVDAIRKYLLRSDKPATKKRIATMEARIKELCDLDKKYPSLNIEPDSYLPVLESTKEKCAKAQE